MADFQDNVIDNTVTITASATSATFVRPTRLYGNRKGVLLVNIGADPTGTNPTLKFSLQASLDGTTWYDVGNSGNLTATTNYRLEFEAIEPFYQVKKTIGGTATPTFTLVTSHLLFMHD